MDRKVFTDLRSNCKTKRQMRAFNELLQSFASKSGNSDLKYYRKFAGDIHKYLVEKLKLNNNDVSAVVSYDKSEDLFTITASVHGGETVELPEKYYDKVFNYTEVDAEDAAIDLAAELL